MKIYRCKHCGNIAVLPYDSGAPMSCCGEPMMVLEAGVTDAAVEKHVPAVEAQGLVLNVTVGAVEHPMTEEHYIQTILLVQGDKVQYVKLKPGSAPKASFTVEAGPYEVYEYCNLHGLWKMDGKA